MATSAPAHAGMNDRQGRLSLTMIDDRTLNTTSTTSTTPLTPVARLESSDAANATKVDQILEIGAGGIVGGVAHLGSYKGSFNRNAVNLALLGLLTSKKQSATPGVTTTWGYSDFVGAEFDYVRLLADQLGTVWGAVVGLGAILSKPKYAAKVGGQTMESYDFQGPHLVQIDGYPVSKAYTILAGDVTAGNVPVSSTFYGALNTATPGAEIPKPVPIPVSGQQIHPLYASGRVNFLKIMRVMSANGAIGGVNYFTGNLVRYRENQSYLVTASSLGTIGAQTALTFTASGTNYVGPEITVGSNIIVDVGGANQETCPVTAVSGNTVTFTTTKTHATTGVTVGLAPASGYCLYSPLNGKMVFGDTLVAGDTVRVLFASNDTASVPKTITQPSLDTTSAPGIAGRYTPVTISNNGIPGIQDASIEVGGLERKEVQELGADEVKYGSAGVPNISYSASAYAKDNSLLAQLCGGANASGIYSADYAIRYQTSNALPFTISVKSPTQNQKVLFTITGGQPVLSYEESGAANSETMVRLSGQDMSGVITISATT